MLLIPFSVDVEPRKERLVEAAFGLLVRSAVGGLHIPSQLQGQLDVLDIDGHALLGLGQRVLGGIKFVLELGLLALEQGR
ncbi:MAG TPA: hypothetical protein VHW67_05765 [Solirubrobacteraceae bacterium]|nr:hypothetical protein [Solirubrobacteraceae bacterium]